MKRVLFSVSAVLLMAGQVMADAPIAPGAVSPMTKDAYPKTFSKWGAAGMKKINGLAQKAAEHAARSPECDRVDIVDLSDSRSVPGKSIVFFVDCANGKRFYVSDSDLAGNNTATSQTAKMEGLSDGKAILSCENAIKAKLNHPSTFDKKAFTTLVHRAKTTGNVSVTFDFDAKNGFGAMMPHSARCVFSDQGLEEATISTR